MLAIAASSTSNAWLLAQLSTKASYPEGAVALFHRIPVAERPGEWQWDPVELAEGAGTEKLALATPVQGGETKPFTVAGVGEVPAVKSQLLTVTSEGVWIDGERGDVNTTTPASTTLFFKPEGNGEADGKGLVHGTLAASWCELPPGAPAGTPPCQRELPDPLPLGTGRSFAWAASGTPFGKRVITGLPGGVTLSLEGEAFTPVLSLGAGKNNEEDPGANYGAAFSEPDEGWLGLAGALPVDLTANPVQSTLSPWPVSFRHPMLAIAPQPGAPVGSLSSEALAVGELGAVARYKPGVGWLPESLFGPGERIETPRLRAIAWPTRGRAYAVGDGGEMWLWRSETGLWEHDPATPLNFRGNMVGVAFDPDNPALGYAVGSSAVAEAPGVLLRYGKTWTQASESELPSQAHDASFVGIAFAGSEAIVAYRTRSSVFHSTEEGGLLVNDGSGWQVDPEAASLVGSGVPGALAALPDGGAAFTVIGREGGTRLYEREHVGSPWQATPTPPPGEFAGALTLYREGGEGGPLRAILSNAGGVGVESEQQKPPPGFPPDFEPPLPPGGEAKPGGDLIRQTSSGWSDEDHELNPIGEPTGHFLAYDLPYRPDAVQAVLVGPGGEGGWAVGGDLDSANERLQTADIERYQSSPSEQVTPLGLGSSQVPLNPAAATFAIGGGAQCGAPCAERARDGIGPDVWLQTALQRARNIGVRAFLYSGPHITTGKTNGEKSPIPFAQEFAGYAEILASAPLPTYAAISPYDLNARPEFDGDEAEFERAFAGFPTPFGSNVSAVGLPEAPNGGPPERERCAGEVGCQAGYYAFDSEGSSGTVRVIVLDDSADVEMRQLEWLRQQLSSSQAGGVPAIVVGEADLNAQIGAGDKRAAEVAGALGQSGACASAYFYDAPEVNVTQPLREASCGSQPIPTFGSGTLGYVDVSNEALGDFHGASGFLVGEVDLAPSARKAGNLAPVSTRLIPDIGELALEAKDGILLRRSEPTLFAALARRPRAGGVARSLRTEQRNRPLHSDPGELRGRGVRTRSAAARIPVQLLQRRSRPVRHAEPRLPGPACRGAGTGRQTDPRSAIGAVLCLQRGHHDRHHQRRRIVIVAAGDRAARQRARALRHRAAEEPTRAAAVAGGPRAAAARARSRARRSCPRPGPPGAAAATAGAAVGAAARGTAAATRTGPSVRAAARARSAPDPVRAATRSLPGAPEPAVGHLCGDLADRDRRTRRGGGERNRVRFQPGGRLPPGRTRAGASLPAWGGAAGGAGRSLDRAPSTRAPRGAHRACHAVRRALTAADGQAAPGPVVTVHAFTVRSPLGNTLVVAIGETPDEPTR